MKTKIYAYNTHYEIIDYNLGDFLKLERDLSVWDDVYHKLVPRYYYDSELRILYVPRGYDPTILSEYFKTFIDFKPGYTDRRKVSFNTRCMPRNCAQKESVRFLSGKNEYSHMLQDTQQVLSMPPGDGKTYCAISALSLLGYRSIIIVNTSDLRNQWKSSFEQYTDISSNYIKVIDSMIILDNIMTNSPKGKRFLSGSIVFVTTHDIIRNFMKKYGFRSMSVLFSTLQIGVKVIDEIHLEYVNTLMIDYSTNVWKTIYLTATFARSDNDDDKVFQKSFNMIHKLKIESEKKRRHVIYIPYVYRTKPSVIIRQSIRGLKGFDKYKYSDYEFSQGKLFNVIDQVLELFIEKRKIEGKIIILSSKKEACDRLKDHVSNIYPTYSTCVHYTGNKQADYKEYGIIFATPKMLGTAIDIPGLRLIINLEPSRSTVNTAQIIGRLREYSPDKDTYYVELIDKAFSNVWDMFKVRQKFLSSIVKKEFVIDETIIKY